MCILGLILYDQVVIVCTDGRIFCQGGAWHTSWIIESNLKRSISLHGELLSLWGKASPENPQPWSPLAHEYHRANLLLYWVGARGPELLGYKKTEGEPILVVISKKQNKCLIVVEQKVTQRGEKSFFKRKEEGKTRFNFYFLFCITITKK